MRAKINYPESQIRGHNNASRLEKANAFHDDGLRGVWVVHPQQLPLFFAGENFVWKFSLKRFIAEHATECNQFFNKFSIKIGTAPTPRGGSSPSHLRPAVGGVQTGGARLRAGINDRLPPGVHASAAFIDRTAA